MTRTTGILNSYARTTVEWLHAWLAVSSCQRIGITYPARLWRSYEALECQRRASERD